MLRWLKVFICGLCMGAADIVPGISGGTMAFILGIYERLLWSIKSINLEALKLLFGGKFRQFSHSISLPFLFTLILGILFAIVSLAHVIEYSLNHETYRTFLYSLFLGLVLASVYLVSKRIELWHFKLMLCFLFGFFCAFTITFFPFAYKTTEPLYSVSIPENQLDFKLEALTNYQDGKLLNVPEATLSAMVSKGIITEETIVEGTNTVTEARNVIKSETRRYLNFWMIFCGSIAISAMLLPGISGSYFLVILGAYPIVISALSDTLKGFTSFAIDFDSVLILINLGMGIIIGAALFSRIISWSLSHYHNETVGALSGFMVGALPAIWPYCSYEAYLLPLKLAKGPQLRVVQLELPPFLSIEFLISLACIILGYVIVISIDSVASRVHS